MRNEWVLKRTRKIGFWVYSACRGIPFAIGPRSVYLMKSIVLNNMELIQDVASKFRHINELQSENNRLRDGGSFVLTGLI